MLPLTIGTSAAANSPVSMHLLLSRDVVVEAGYFNPDQNCDLPQACAVVALGVKSLQRRASDLVHTVAAAFGDRECGHQRMKCRSTAVRVPSWVRPSSTMRPP